MKASELAAFLDETLEVSRFQDVSNNGLQIDSEREVQHVAFGVDASLRTFRAAADVGADLLVCHHGLSWGDSLRRITGLNYQLISTAIRNDLAVYAVHLPLDVHPVYGNNAQICDLLDVQNRVSAFSYHGNQIGLIGTLREPVCVERFCERVRDRISPHLMTALFGSKQIRTIGVVSGGASDMVEQAVEAGVDLFLSGEPGLAGYTLAENFGTNLVCAGHYATETWGVAALAKLVAERFGLQKTVFDFKIPF